jgi:IS5 family transposase
MKYQVGFFEVQESYERLDKQDRLLELHKMIDWSGLKEIMEQIKFNKSGQGRKPLSGLLMGKILILQAKYNLSDEGMEFAINDRLTFKRFLEIGVAQKAPDAKTIWVWRERVEAEKLDLKVFEWFSNQLQKQGFEMLQGQMVDASFVPTHKPTGKQGDKTKLLQEGEVAGEGEIGFLMEKEELFCVNKGGEKVLVKSDAEKGLHKGLHKKIMTAIKEKRKIRLSHKDKRDIRSFSVMNLLSDPFSPSVECQIDKDATFTKKRGQSYFGFKNHILACVKHKFIWGFRVTTASTHDHDLLKDLLKPVDSAHPEDLRVFGDSAYRSAAHETLIEQKNLTSHICQKGARNRPLTQEQRESNTEKSKCRARVEHIFGHINTCMSGFKIHTIGESRAKVKTAFKNVVYNMERLICVIKQQKKRENYA